MAKRILFDPSEYRELNSEDQALLQLAYQKAIEALHRNITPAGFSACSLKDNQVYGTDVNYRSVWARDGAKTTIWSLELEDSQIHHTQELTLRTILRHQAPAGQLPAHVLIDSDTPEYGGVGGITAIDSVLWIIIATYRYCKHYDDWALVEDHIEGLQRAMDWLSAHDSNNNGLLEIPEAGDWTDLFARSYHVLYDEILWHRCLVYYSQILRQLGKHDKAQDYEDWSKHVRRVILKTFWPSTLIDLSEGGPSFADVQFGLGDSRYLLAQISPFSYSWRCDVYANLLAYLTNLIDRERAMMTFHFLWGVGVNDPHPVKNLYPPVNSGDPEWRNYFTVNLLNLPDHYHNGGIWPFVGGLWVRYIHKLGMRDLARREAVNLARMCAQGVSHEWEFNEWHHGKTGRPMGKAFQAWSAASFISACHSLHLDPESLFEDDHV
ncbi:Mannosylfructose-phosphate phosphatase [Planctomycetales bacterium 10988]|nr:Mannosylfructose-phosphate phosphatase [Planctomycetales bacterium 10988]